MKFCERSLKDLIDIMIKVKLTISEDRVWKIISQFFIALAVLNERNMAHRDVKDGNIFIDEDDNIVLGVVSSFIVRGVLLYVQEITGSRRRRRSTLTSWRRRW
jgi:serine/threonine protein kinase